MDRKVDIPTIKDPSPTCVMPMPVLDLAADIRQYMELDRFGGFGSLQLAFASFQTANRRPNTKARQKTARIVLATDARSF